MKIVMIVLAIIGAFIFATGLSAYIEAVNSGEVINTFFGMLFSSGLMVLGVFILVVDLIIFLVYKTRRRREPSNT